jgi:hypothetical protein
MTSAFFHRGQKRDESDPEGAIQRREPGPALAPRVDLELLSQRQFDESLIPTTSEKSEGATEDRERQSRYGPHRGLILLGYPAAKED